MDGQLCFSCERNTRKYITDLCEDCNSIAVKASDELDKQDTCLVRKFFEDEKKKPAHLRNKSCMISCSCSRCNPARM